MTTKKNIPIESKGAGDKQVMLIARSDSAGIGTYFDRGDIGGYILRSMDCVRDLHRAEHAVDMTEELARSQGIWGGKPYDEVVADGAIAHVVMREARLMDSSALDPVPTAADPNPYSVLRDTEPHRYLHADIDGLAVIGRGASDLLDLDPHPTHSRIIYDTEHHHFHIVVRYPPLSPDEKAKKIGGAI